VRTKSKGVSLNALGTTFVQGQTCKPVTVPTVLEQEQQPEQIYDADTLIGVCFPPQGFTHRLAAANSFCTIVSSDLPA
jgi:hypothetical protein